MERKHSTTGGFTFIEVLVTLVIGGIVLASLSSLIHTSLKLLNGADTTAETTLQADFAMQRIVNAIRMTPKLLVPQKTEPGNVLGLAMDPTLDRDGDGFADADNDKDGKVNEDWGADANFDGANGIKGIDDDGHGQIDDGTGPNDDDEDGVSNEDYIDATTSTDQDGDGLYDEDPGSDMDNNGSTDDDGDGKTDEDWLDTVVYFLSGTDLMERMPNIGAVSGADYTERIIASNVTSFSVQRATGSMLVTVTLVLSPSGTTPVSLTASVRAGSGL